MINRNQTVEAPIIKVYFQGVEIEGLYVKKLTYVNAEDEDDTCELEVETGDRDLPSNKMIQEKLVWVVMWGYMNKAQRKRIIRLQEIKWVYGSNSITGNITGTDLGSALKRDSKRKVWKNTNMLAMAAEVAEQNGLDLVVDANKTARNPEALKDKTDSWLDLGLDESQQNLTPVDRRIINQLQQVRNQVTDYKEVRKNFYSVLDDPKILAKLPTGGKIDNTYVKMYGQWKHWDAIPQAGKSTIAILKEVGALEPGGPYLVETRDNKLIIRRRAFNQTPYKSYEYGGGNSDLIEFTPESSNRSMNSSATALDYGGWNSKNKEYFSGTRAPGTINDYVLSQLQDTKRVLEELPPEQLRTIVTGEIVGKQESRNQSGLTNTYYGVRTGDKYGGNAPLSDNTRVVKILNLPKTAEQELNAVKEALGETDNVKVHDPKANNGLDSAANADNIAKNAELEKNPASAKIIGDPEIEPGMIITILEVSKKYMGNYYVSKVTDEPDSSSGYITTLELSRQGHNIKVLSTQKTAKELNNKYNPETGPEVGNGKRVRVTTKKNR